jgi:hypothetical protein
VIVIVSDSILGESGLSFLFFLVSMMCAVC